jgi:hypothetical protein
MEYDGLIEAQYGVSITWNDESLEIIYLFVPPQHRDGIEAEGLGFTR